jgi:hypothetical protein
MTQVVPLRPGDEAVVRLPTAAEHRAHHLDQDEPVVEIRRRDGTREVYGAHQVTVLAG